MLLAWGETPKKRRRSGGGPKVSKLEMPCKFEPVLGRLYALLALPLRRQLFVRAHKPQKSSFLCGCSIELSTRAGCWLPARRRDGLPKRAHFPLTHSSFTCPKHRHRETRHCLCVQQATRAPVLLAALLVGATFAAHTYTLGSAASNNLI